MKEEYLKNVQTIDDLITAFYAFISPPRDENWL